MTELYVSGARPAALPDYEGRGTTQRRAWWVTPYGRWRLSVELKAMRRFPGFELNGLADGRLGWRGWVESSLAGGDRYLVRIIYPRAFPDEPPEVSIDEPVLPTGVPHLLDGNRPSLYRPVDGPRHGYDPARTTAATLLAWTVLWVNAYETFRATGSWPGRAD